LFGDGQESAVKALEPAASLPVREFAPVHFEEVACGWRMPDGSAAQPKNEERLAAQVAQPSPKAFSNKADIICVNARRDNP
jgi:hypothetical protein